MARDLNLLHPSIRPRVDFFLESCRQHGIDLLVTCTYRSPEEQEALYALGRTKPGKRVTNAKPGQSMHNATLAGKPASLAIDVVPLRNGKPVWATGDSTWRLVGELGEEAGLEWAGRWVKFREFPHFQHPEAKSLKGVNP